MAASVLLVVRQDPVGQALESGAQALVLQILDQAAIALRQLRDDRARECGVFVEDATYGVGRDEHHDGAFGRARGLQIELVEDDRGEDEGGRRLQIGERGLAAAAGRVELD